MDQKALRELRDRCQAKLRSLDLPPPTDARAFCEALAASRGRPIGLCPVTSRLGPCGVWVASPTTDFIFYEPDTSRLHQEHIILHEAGHILWGHAPKRVSKVELQRLMFPDVRQDMVQMLLRRTPYSTQQEREAEVLASLVLERMAAGRPATENRTSGNGSDEDDLIKRLEASLDGSTGDQT